MYKTNMMLFVNFDIGLYEPKLTDIKQSYTVALWSCVQWCVGSGREEILAWKIPSTSCCFLELSMAGFFGLSELFSVNWNPGGLAWKLATFCSKMDRQSLQKLKLSNNTTNTYGGGYFPFNRFSALEYTIFTSCTDRAIHQISSNVKLRTSLTSHPSANQNKRGAC